MKKLRCENLDGELLTVEQVQSLCNLGMHSVRKLAEEARAVRRIGRSYRINKKIFFAHIETMYAE